nr:5734_t:CDS:2 [Entrophospora candida]
MSKSQGNIVNPDPLIKEYGADALRLYEVFLGPPEQTTKAVLTNIRNPEIENAYYEMVMKSNLYYEKIKLNLVVSSLMVFINECYKAETKFMPTECFLGESSLPQTENSPTISSSQINIVVQINGQKKIIILAKKDASQKEIEELVKKDPKINRKTILLVGGGILFLTIFITTALFINASQKESPVSVPQKNGPNPDNSSLIRERGEAITLLKRKLTSDNIQKENLLQNDITPIIRQIYEIEKKFSPITDEGMIKIDWSGKKENGEPVVPPEDKTKLNQLGKECLEKLEKEIKEIKSKNPDPLEGIDLKGVGMDELRKKSVSSRLFSEEAAGKIATDAPDKVLALPLRVRLCYGLVLEKERFLGSGEHYLKLKERQIIVVSKAKKIVYEGMSEEEKKEFNEKQGGMTVAEIPIKTNILGNEDKEYSKLKYKDEP